MWNVYLAAAYNRKEEIKHFAKRLTHFLPNVEVVSSWIHESYSPNITLKEVSEFELSATANKDFCELAKSNILIAFSQSPEVPSVRGGRHVELGIALGLGDCLICIIGPKENIFHYLDLPTINHFDSERDCVTFIEEYIQCHS